MSKAAAIDTVKLLSSSFICGYCIFTSWDHFPGPVASPASHLGQQKGMPLCGHLRTLTFVYRNWCGL